MYETKVLGLEEAQGAIAAMIEEVQQGNYWKHGAFAVMDTAGSLIAFARMDGSNWLSGQNALRKAYTAVGWGRDTSQWWQFIQDRPWDASTYGPDFTVVPGGVVIVEPGIEPEAISRTPEITDLGIKSEESLQFRKHYVLGSIGVAAVGPWMQDDKVARVGLEYIQNVLWPGK